MNYFSVIRLCIYVIRIKCLVMPRFSESEMAKKNKVSWKIKMTLQRRFSNGTVMAGMSIVKESSLLLNGK